MTEIDRLYFPFYQLYRVANSSRSEIISSLNLSPTMYMKLVQEVKRREHHEVTTELLEKIACDKLNANPNDPEGIKLAIEIWKFKHKIPTPIKDTTEDAAAMMNTNGTPEPSFAD